MDDNRHTRETRSVLAKAQSTSHHAGYQQALADVMRMIDGAQVHVSGSVGASEYAARMDTFSHMRAMVRGRMNERKRRRGR